MEKPNRTNRKQARQRRQRIRSAIFAVIVVSVLGLAGYYLKSAFFKPGPPPMAGNVIDIKADMSGFDQKEIRMKLGEPVTVRLTTIDNTHNTDGGAKHQWEVDELAVSIIAPPEGSEYATFTPNKPGEYTFYCDICYGGKANPSMNGKLIVEG